MIFTLWSWVERSSIIFVRARVPRGFTVAGPAGIYCVYDIIQVLKIWQSAIIFVLSCAVFNLIFSRSQNEKKKNSSQTTAVDRDPHANSRTWRTSAWSFWKSSDGRYGFSLATHRRTYDEDILTICIVIHDYTRPHRTAIIYNSCVT